MADSSLGYTGFMVDDPVSPPASDTNASQTTETPNRPEPTTEAQTTASESASSQTEEPQPEPSQAPPPPASESAGPQPSQAPNQQSSPSETSPTPEPLQALETPSDESVSISASPQTAPSISTPSAQVVPAETEPEKSENQSVQAATEPQSQPEPEAPQPQNQDTAPPASSLEPSPVPAPSVPYPPFIPSLHYPFYGNYPVTFDFGAKSTDERIKKKYQEWGIVGHNGLDFGLQEGTEVLACDDGIATQAGDNGDHGISVTIRHSWGTSIYSHLQSFGLLVNDPVKKAQVIGSSGQTGFTTGPHLHFGIQPVNPDTNNGYLGFIDPKPYFTETTPLPQSPQSPISPQSPKPPDLSSDLSEQPPQSPQPSEPTSEPTPPLPNPPAPPNPSSSPVPSPTADQEEVQKQAVAMFDVRLKENSIKGNQAKKDKRDEAIQKIFAFAQEKKRVTNEQIRDLLHVSQSTASDYLSDLVNRGMLKTEGKGRATVYLF